MAASHGRPLHLSEVATHAQPGDSLRVLGTLQRIDYEAGSITLAHSAVQLRVDFKAVPDIRLTVGLTLQAIGEVLEIDGEPMLRARLLNDMTGVDLELYGRSVELQRKFLAELGLAPPAAPPTACSPASAHDSPGVCGAGAAVPEPCLLRRANRTPA